MDWYALNKRDLPWRATRDPYKIWLSEIILQQTRVAQGMPYYHNFLEAFPTVYDLARAPEESVLKLWQGLGYYSRARNLHATAKIVVGEFQGEFPNTYKGLLSLKGVGDYTASAIASICFDLPEPVVDGNVYRVLSRYFGVKEPINSSAGIKTFKKLAREVISTANIRDYNQGIMEFGAIQCAPKNPNCNSCPLNTGCEALKKNKVDQWPIKINKTRIRHRYFNYLVYLDREHKTFLEKREGKGIWQNLYQFPLIETEKPVDHHNLTRLLPQNSKIPMEKVSLYNEQAVVHKLSHQHLHTHFWIVETDELQSDGIPWTKIQAYPVPVLIADFIKTFKI